MMKDTILDAIREYNAAGSGSGSPSIADWRLVRKSVFRQEQYFVRDAMEQARAVDESNFVLTVYVDSLDSGRKTRGEATATIQPSLSREEIEARIRRAAFAASKSRNAWFDLPGPAEPKVSVPESGFASLGDAGRMAAVKDALYSPECPPKGSGAGSDAGAGMGSCSGDPAGGNRAGGAGEAPRINSLEIFISRDDVEMCNSKGFSTTATRWQGYSEFVVDAKAAGGPVELFDDISFSEPDSVRLAAATRSRLAQVRDRAIALPMPRLKDIPVILRGKEAEEAFSWFFANSGSSAIFTKSSSFQQGKSVQSGDRDEPVADPIDIWAEPVLPGIPLSAPFDADGFPLERLQVIDKGVLTTIVGSIRHADWLAVPRKGNFAMFSVSPGKTTLAEMHSAPYLEPVKFSDFRLDSVTGDFGAEIRLAYYFDGSKTIPVTGGSVSGSLSASRASMLRSAEREVVSKSFCPVALLLRNVSISGV